VRHSGASPEDEIEVSVSATERGVRVEVADRGPGFEPRPRAEGHDEGSGWGLHLVDRLSDRWGAGRDGPTSVWFEVTVERGGAGGEGPGARGGSAAGATVFRGGPEPIVVTA
jgi:anti-sigma regulatory factor (Ser/Thr protein kinase)